MLVQFSVANYLSFRENTTLSMLASRQTEYLEVNTAPCGNLNLLKSAVVYGANASGKSNLLKAIFIMRQLVVNSSKDTQAQEALPISKFKFSSECDNKPSIFEIIFIHDSVRYRYGFEVDEKIIHSEWLFTALEDEKERQRFLRKDGRFVLTDFPEGERLGEITRSNALFISVAAQFNGSIATKIIEWFDRLVYISGIDDATASLSKKMIRDKRDKQKIIDFLRAADVGIDGIEITERPLDKHWDQLAEPFKSYIRDSMYTEVRTIHKKYDASGTYQSDEMLSLETDESTGTRKLFSLAGPIIDCLEHGKILIVDELDARLHPLITKFIIALFNSCGNKNASQLIFATHDTNLLLSTSFRRDQIWFVEKDDLGASSMYSLSDFKLEGKSVRKDASFEKDYILGKYGAIPFIGNLSRLYENDETVAGEQRLF